MSLFQHFTVAYCVHAVGGICQVCLSLYILFLMQTGKTPMYFAAQYNHPKLVELFLAHGADINKVQHCIM